MKTILDIKIESIKTTICIPYFDHKLPSLLSHHTTKVNLFLLEGAHATTYTILYKRKNLLLSLERFMNISCHSLYSDRYIDS